MGLSISTWSINMAWEGSVVKEALIYSSKLQLRILSNDERI